MFKHCSLRRLTIATLACIAASGVLAFNFIGGKWRDGRTTFHVSIPGFAPSGQSWDSAFIDAMERWTAQTDFTFDVDQTPVDPCAGSMNGDARNSAGFRTTVCGNAFGANVLAMTLTSYHPGSFLGFRSTSQTDIVFNSNLTWDIYSGRLRSSVDFGRVALHELGHALGLGHENGATAIMNSFITDLDTLQVDDLAGVNAMYGPRGNCAFAEISLNTGVNDALQTGDCRVMDLFGGISDPSFLDIYQFSLSDPTYVNIQMRSNELDPVLIITDTSLGNQMIFDDFDGTCDAIVAQTLPAGTYLLIANTYVVPDKCAGNIGSYSLTITDSDLPLLGAVVNTNPGAQVTSMIFSGGASVDGVDFRNSFSAAELIDVQAQVAPDPAHIGLPGSIYVLAILGNGQQFIKDRSGEFVPFSGALGDIAPNRRGVLRPLEKVTIVENLQGSSTNLAGHSFTVYVGYSVDSAPFEIYHNSLPIQFSIAPAP